MPIEWERPFLVPDGIADRRLRNPAAVLADTLTAASGTWSNPDSRSAKPIRS
jgi:hypothetical protein